MELAGILTRRWNGFTVRAYFLLVVVGVLCPALAIGGRLAWISVQTERAQLEENVGQKTREINDAIDREISSAENLLQALGSSHLLVNERFEEFHKQLTKIARQLQIQIVLHDLVQNIQIINTEVSWGASLAAGSTLQPSVRDDLLTGKKTFVSNLIAGPLIKRNVVAVGVPVTIEGDKKYLLGLSISVDKLAEIFGRSQFDSRFIATIIGRDRVIIARSESQAKYSGHQVSTDLYKLTVDDVGIFYRTNLDGNYFRWNYQRSKVTGWIILVGVPDAILSAPARTMIIAFAISGGVLLILAVGVALLLSNQISKAIRGIKDSSVSFFAGEEKLALSRVREADEVSATLTEYGSRRNSVLSAADIGNWSFEIPARMIIWSDAFKRIVGLAPETRPSAEAVERLLLPSDRNLLRRRIKQSLAFGHPLDAEFRVSSDNESPKWISVKATGQRSGKGIVLQGIVQDITKRKQAEEERDDLRRRLMLTQEHERSRLARELHDQTGQSITAILLNLKELEGFISTNGLHRIFDLRTQLNSLGKEMNSIAWELRPTAIDELGLSKALRSYIEGWSQRFGKPVDFLLSDTGIDSYSEEIDTVIYRVVQEALTNVARHAKAATNVSIVIDHANNVTRLLIEDNGPGFCEPVKSNSKGGGLGLAGMRERLKLVGGELFIESSANSGTTIYARLPWQQES
ncbi:MAG: PAS domain S-box protein [Xanthobacteraceae bacterium]|nr:PAS domain S-box protein [Xanthobacteraceae bacterium]